MASDKKLIRLDSTYPILEQHTVQIFLCNGQNKAPKGPKSLNHTTTLLHEPNSFTEHHHCKRVDRCQQPITSMFFLHRFIHTITDKALYCMTITWVIRGWLVLLLTLLRLAGGVRGEFKGRPPSEAICKISRISGVSAQSTARRPNMFLKQSRPHSR